MPQLDGSGPISGPQTGRRLGWCSTRRGSSKGGSLTNAGGSSLIGRVIVPLIGVVVTDLLRPNSVIRQLTSKVAKRLAEPKQRYLPMEE